MENAEATCDLHVPEHGVCRLVIQSNESHRVLRIGCCWRLNGRSNFFDLSFGRWGPLEDAENTGRRLERIMTPRELKVFSAVNLESLSAFILKFAGECRERWSVAVK